MLCPKLCPPRLKSMASQRELLHLSGRRRLLRETPPSEIARDTVGMSGTEGRSRDRSETASLSPATTSRGTLGRLVPAAVGASWGDLGPTTSSQRHSVISRHGLSTEGTADGIHHGASFFRSTGLALRKRSALASSCPVGSSASMDSASSLGSGCLSTCDMRTGGRSSCGPADSAPA